MSLRQLIPVLLMMVTLGLGQEPGNGEPEQPPPPPPPPEGPTTPRELLKEFEKRVRQYAHSKAHADLEYTGELFDFEGIPSFDHPALGAQAARDLASVLNRIRVLPYNVSSKAEEPSPYVLHLRRAGEPVGEVELTRSEDTLWRFSRKTLNEISTLQGKVKDLPLHGAAIHLPVQGSITTIVRDAVPMSLRQKKFLIEHWQWLGLFILIVAGLLLELLSSWVLTWLEIRFFRKRQLPLREVGRGPGRPVGRLLMAALWVVGLQFLVLPSGAHTLILSVARFVMMAAMVWVVWRLVDLVADFFQARAKTTHSRLDDQLVPMLRRSVKIFVGIAGVLWIAHTLDFNLRALLAGVGLGGLAFALAAKDTVNNLFGSLTIMLDRPFFIGDWIVIGDIEGTVENVGFRSCRVRTFYNSLISFPNAMLIKAAVDNMGVRRYRRIKTNLGVAYDTPPEKMAAFVEGIRELIRRHPYTRKDYFHVYLHGFSPSSLDVLVYAFLEVPDWGTELREKQRLYLDILRLAHRLEVEFAFPTQTVRLLQGEALSAAHPDSLDTPAEAGQQGREEARRIVEQFTGSEKPPPVQILPPGQDRGSDEDDG